jgi:3'(2'), 5'-bisphosphate nucleotidase
MVSDADLAGAIAGQAGQLLLALRDRGRLHAATVTADIRSDELIAGLLRKARPEDAILSEEGASTGDRLRAARVWIIDPLDGTREYGEAGRDDWAVHVALWQDGALTAGAVAIPSRAEIWSTSEDAAPIQRPIARIAVSRTRPAPWALAVAEQLHADVVPIGSAGAKLAAILRGDVDAYLHGGGQYEWDSAAPVAVARHYGLAATRADGRPLLYNQPDPYLPDLVIAPAEALPSLLDAIAWHVGHGEDSGAPGRNIVESGSRSGALQIGARTPSLNGVGGE